MLTIGADIEAEFVSPSSGRVCIPEGVMLSHRNTRHGNWGLDGSYNILEFRPRYSEDAEEMFGNFLSLVRDAHGNGLLINFNTRRYPCGFHVHFGNVSFNPREFVVSFGLACVRESSLGDFPQQITRRRYGYGRFEDWRTKSWGFEYRALPAVLCANPETAKTILKVLYATATEGIGRRLKNKFIETIEEARTYAFLPYYFAPIPQVGSEVVGEEFASWLEDEMRRRLSPPYPIVTFYSLHANRGMVTAGLRTSMTEEIPHPNENTANLHFRFGIPFRWKRRGVPRQVWEEIARAVELKVRSFYRETLARAS